MVKKSWFYPAKLITTIEVKNNFIRILQLEVANKKKKKLLNYTSIKLNKQVSNREEFAELLIKEIGAYIRKSGLKIDKVRISIAATETIFRNIIFPQLDKSELAAAVKWDSSEYLMKPLADYYYDYQISYQNSQQQAVFLVAVEKLELDSVFKVADQVKGCLELVTIDILAVLKLIPAEKTELILLEVEEQQAIISLISKRNLIKQEKVNLSNCQIVKLSANEFFSDKLSNDTSQKFLKLYIEQLGLLINDLLSKYELETNNSPSNELYLYGSLAQLVYQEKNLANQTAVQINLIQPFSQIDLGEKYAHLTVLQQESEFTCCVGLALEQAVTEINLLPEGRRQLICSSKLIALVSIIICLTAMLNSFLLYQKQYQKYQLSANNQLELATWEKREKQLQEIQQGYRNQEVIIKKIEQQRSNWYKVLEQLGVITPEEVKIVSLVNLQNNQYLLQLEAQDMASFTNFTKYLQSKNITSEIVVQSLEAEKQNQGKLKVKIKIKIVGVHGETNKLKVKNTKS